MRKRKKGEKSVRDAVHSLFIPADVFCIYALILALMFKDKQKKVFFSRVRNAPHRILQKSNSRIFDKNLPGKDFNSVLYQEEECPVTVWYFLYVDDAIL